MKTTIRYILLTALRDKLFVGLFATMLVAFGVAWFLGGTSIVEQNAMAASYAAGTCRIVLAVGMTVFIAFHVRRSVENKELEMWLTKPLSRQGFVCAYFLGFAGVALLLMLPLAPVLWAWGASPVALAVWWSSLLLEGLLVVGLALFTALLMQSAVASVMATLGFYFLSRLIGFFVMAAQKPYATGGDALATATRYILEGVSTVLPRLDFFAQTDWLVYGPGDKHEYILACAQAGIYIPFLLLAIIFDFRRKQF